MYMYMYSKTVEIKTTTQKGTDRGYLFQACHGKDVSHSHLYLAESKWQAEVWENSVVRKKRRLQVCSDWKLLA